MPAPHDCLQLVPGKALKSIAILVHESRINRHANQLADFSVERHVPAISFAQSLSGWAFRRITLYVSFYGFAPGFGWLKQQIRQSASDAGGQQKRVKVFGLQG